MAMHAPVHVENVGPLLGSNQPISAHSSALTNSDQFQRRQSDVYKEALSGSLHRGDGLPGVNCIGGRAYLVVAGQQQHICAVGVDAHMPPEVGVGTSFVRIHIAHVGQGRAGTLKATAIGRQQHLHQIGIVQLLSAEPIDGRQHLGGRLANDEGCPATIR